MLAAISGAAAVLHTSAVSFQTLKYAGIAYLVYMAVTTWREGGVLRIEPTSAPPRTTGQVIGSGVLISLLNPKLKRPGFDDCSFS